MVTTTAVAARCLDEGDDDRRGVDENTTTADPIQRLESARTRQAPAASHSAWMTFDNLHDRYDESGDYRFI